MLLMAFNRALFGAVFPFTGIPEFPKAPLNSNMPPFLAHLPPEKRSQVLQLVAQRQMQQGQLPQAQVAMQAIPQAPVTMPQMGGNADARNLPFMFQTNTIVSPHQNMNVMSGMGIVGMQDGQGSNISQHSVNNGGGMQGVPGGGVGAMNYDMLQNFMQGNTT